MRPGRGARVREQAVYAKGAMRQAGKTLPGSPEGEDVLVRVLAGTQGEG